MKNIILTLLVVLLLFTQVGGAMASIDQAGASAVLATTDIVNDGYDYRVFILKSYLEQKQSPLANEVDTFIAVADTYGLDWRFIPAITGVESGFAKRMPFNSYNAYGWAGGKTYFDSWDTSINLVGKTLKEKYIEKGAVTIPQIAKRYAPPSTTWAWKVEFFMAQIDPIPVTFDL